MTSFSGKASVRIQLGALLSAAIIAIGILQYLMFYVAVTSVEFKVGAFFQALGFTGITIFLCMIGVVIAVDICINKILSAVEAEIEFQKRLNSAVVFIDRHLK